MRRTGARDCVDVAALAVQLKKLPSARLSPMPGKQRGEEIAFSDPLLFPSKVLALEP
jgi:uncharacterized protein (UPF0210 family)